jgi:hypothetical protein
MEVQDHEKVEKLQEDPCLTGEAVGVLALKGEVLDIQDVAGDDAAASAAHALPASPDASTFDLVVDHFVDAVVVHVHSS